MKKLILLISLFTLLGCDKQAEEPKGKVIFYTQTGIYTIQMPGYKGFIVSASRVNPSCVSVTTPGTIYNYHDYYVLYLPLGKHTVNWRNSYNATGERTFTVRDIQCTILDCSQLNGWQ